MRTITRLCGLVFAMTAFFITEVHATEIADTIYLADFVVLSKDPTAIDPEPLDTLKVLTTIKEDILVFAID